jgi:hypothetical protein
MPKRPCTTLYTQCGFLFIPYCQHLRCRVIQSVLTRKARRDAGILLERDYCTARSPAASRMFFGFRHSASAIDAGTGAILYKESSTPTGAAARGRQFDRIAVHHHSRPAYVQRPGSHEYWIGSTHFWDADIPLLRSHGLNTESFPKLMPQLVSPDFFACHPQSRLSSDFAPRVISHSAKPLGRAITAYARSLRNSSGSAPVTGSNEIDPHLPGS